MGLFLKNLSCDLQILVEKKLIPGSLRFNVIVFNCIYYPETSHIVVVS